MSLYCSLSSVFLVSVVLNILLHSIQVNGQQKSETPSQPNQYTQNQEHWYSFTRSAFSSPNLFPDIGGELNYTHRIESLAIEGNGFNWRDDAFYQNGECHQFGSEKCAIRGFLDPLHSDIKVPTDLISEEEGTLLMKLAAARGPHLYGVTTKNYLYAIEHQKKKLTESQAALVLESKKNYIKEKKIRVVADALYDAESYPKDMNPTTIIFNEVLHTSPFSYDKKRPIVNGKYFVVGDGILDPLTKITFRLDFMWNRKNYGKDKAIKEESFTAAYVTPHKRIYHVFQNQNSLVFFSPDKPFNTPEYPKYTNQELEGAALFLQCLGDISNAYCKYLIKKLRSDGPYKLIFLITDEVEKWEFVSEENKIVFVIIEYDTKNILENSEFYKDVKKQEFFKHLSKDGLSFEWKMSTDDQWYPSPKIREAFDRTSQWNLDILAIGGPFYKDFLPGNEAESSNLLESNAAMANARFAGMLMRFVNVKLVNPDTFLGSIERPENITYANLLARAISTATPYVYKGNALPLPLLNTPFAQESSTYQGYAMPVVWQGGGLVNLEKMVSSKMHVSPSKLDLGFTNSDTANRSTMVTIQLENRGDQVVKYHFENVKAVPLEAKNEELTLSLKNAENLALTVTADMRMGANNFENGAISIPPKSKVKFQIKFELPLIKETVSQLYFSGYLKFTPKWMISGTWHIDEVPKYPILHVPYLWVYKK